MARSVLIGLAAVAFTGCGGLSDPGTSKGMDPTVIFDISPPDVDTGIPVVSDADTDSDSDSDSDTDADTDSDTDTDTGADTAGDTGTDTAADTGLDETGFSDTGVTETGTGETGVTDTGVAETGNTDTAAPVAFVGTDIGNCLFLTATDRRGEPTVNVTVSGLSYTPACLRVSPGTTVTITATNAHPLMGQALFGTQPNPISAANGATSASAVAFPSEGSFGFYCDNHGSDSNLIAVAGMQGVVYVGD